MNLKNYYLIAFLTLGIFSCSNDKEGMPSIDDSTAPKSIQIMISNGNALEKRATTVPSTPGDIINDGTVGNVNMVDIYVTNASNVILRRVRVAKTDADWSKLTGAGLKLINVQSTASKVYVFGNLNATDLTAEGSNISDVTLDKTLAQQQDVTDMLYIGLDSDLTPTITEPTPPDATSGTTYVANVDISPIISRFQITNISFVSSGSETVSKLIGTETKTATVAWTGFSGDLTGIFMNRFYVTNKNRSPFDLMENINSLGTITNGQWLFNTTTDLASIASYSNFSSNTYVKLPLPQENTKCYAFNFFPEGLTGTNTPKLHFKLTNLQKTTLTSTKQDVYNPSLFPTSASTHFVNVVSFKKSNGTAMTAADFTANKLYNVSIEIKPYFIQDDIHHVQYNVLCTVTVLPWSTEVLTPEFERN